MLGKRRLISLKQSFFHDTNIPNFVSVLEKESKESVQNDLCEEIPVIASITSPIARQMNNMDGNSSQESELESDNESEESIRDSLPDHNFQDDYQKLDRERAKVLNAICSNIDNTWTDQRKEMSEYVTIFHDLCIQSCEFA